MVAWARESFQGGPHALCAQITPRDGLTIVPRMMFDALEDGTFRFRPDHLCEPALIERFCRLKPVRDWIAELAKKVMGEGDPRFQGNPGPEMRSLMVRILSGEGPEAISTPPSRMRRLALCRIIREIAAHFNIPVARKRGTAAMRSACDVAANAWPDQIDSADAAIRTWYNEKKQWWIYITAIEIAETHVNVRILFAHWSAPARNRLPSDKQLFLTLLVPKEEADYTSDLWFWGKAGKKAEEIVMRGIEELVCRPFSE